MIKGAIAAIAMGGLVGCTSGRSAPETPFPLSVMGEAAAIARARADSVRYPYTTADIRFMSGMIGHHAQAIVGREPRAGRDRQPREYFWRPEGTAETR